MTILTLPGLNGSPQNHWQTEWEKLYGFKRVNQKNWNHISFEEWSEELTANINSNNYTDVIIVAHSMGTHVAVQVAQKLKGRIKGLFLVAPPNLNSPLLANKISGFINPPPKLQIPAEVHISTNDPYSSVEESLLFSRAIGADVVTHKDKGHINAESKIGIWDSGYESFIKFFEKVKNNNTPT